MQSKQGLITKQKLTNKHTNNRIKKQDVRPIFAINLD